MAHLLIARTCLTWFMPVDLRLTATTTARFTAVHIITGSPLTAYNKKTLKIRKPSVRREYGLHSISSELLWIFICLTKPITAFSCQSITTLMGYFLLQTHSLTRDAYRRGASALTSQRLALPWRGEKANIYLFASEFSTLTRQREQRLSGLMA